MLKKITFSALVALMCMAFLTGCPAPHNPDDNPVIEDPEIPVIEKGEVSIDIDLFNLDEDTAKKALGSEGWQAISNSQARKADFADITLWDLAGNAQDQKRVAISNGHVRTKLSGKPDHYLLSISVWDETHTNLYAWELLFRGSVNVTLKAGQEQFVTVPLVVQSTTHFHFRLLGFPEEVAGANQFRMVFNNPEGQEEVMWGDLTTVDGITEASIFLPWTFQGGMLYVEDTDIQSVANFNWMEMISEEWGLPYNNSGVIEVETELWWPGRVLGYGLLDVVDFNSIQEAIDAGCSYIKLGPGSYHLPATVYAGPGMSVTISGKTGQTQIYTETSCAFYATEIGGLSEMAKGGGSYLALENLQIIVRGQGDGRYDDAAVFCEAKSFMLNNCSVIASATTPVVTNYCWNVNVNHCVFPGYGQDHAVVTFNEGPGTMVENSIFSNFQEPLWCSNAAMEFQYCCFWQSGTIIGDGMPGSSQYSTPGLIVEQDPLFDSGYFYGILPSSPCIGAGNDGFNIGLVFE